MRLNKIKYQFKILSKLPTAESYTLSAFWRFYTICMNQFIFILLVHANILEFPRTDHSKLFGQHKTECPKAPVVSWVKTRHKVSIHAHPRVCKKVLLDFLFRIVRRHATRNTSEIYDARRLSYFVVNCEWKLFQVFDFLK